MDAPSLPDLSEHAVPEQREAQMARAQELLKQQAMRVVELMIWDVWGLFEADVTLTKVSYDQEGDTDCVPLFSCKDDSGDDLDDDFATDVAEGWNANTHPAVVAFLGANENEPFWRASFAHDAKKACLRTAEGDLGISSSEATAWAESFGRAVAAHVAQVQAAHLDAVLDDAAPKARGPRM